MSSTRHRNGLKPSTLVLSVGGSLVVPDGEVDVDFLRAFKHLVLQAGKRGWRFVIVVGGGGTARHYQRAAKAVAPLTRDDLDWLGIHSTRLNGHLLRTVFREIAHPIMFKDPTKVPRNWKGRVLIAAGWKPGWSTDYVAVRIAKRLGAEMVLNLSNTDYLYTADPKKDRKATPICAIEWPAYRRMVGDAWDPGMNVPFDPVASKLAHKSRMTAVLANGRDFKNLQAILGGKSFKGTVIY